jgi:hypothetical protein
MTKVTIADEIAAQQGWLRLAKSWRDGWEHRPESDAYKELSTHVAATRKILDRLLVILQEEKEP